MERRTSVVTCWSLLRLKYFLMVPLTQAKKILWIALSKGAGDAVLLYPAVMHCSRLLPKAAVDVVVRNRLAVDVFRAYGFPGQIYEMPKRALARLPWMFRIGAGAYHAVFDASSVEQLHLSRWMTRFFSSGACVGYDYGSSSWLYTHRLDTRPLASLHMKDIYARLLSPLADVPQIGLEPPPPSPSLLESLRLPAGGKRIVVHPGGRDNISDFEKRWPIAHYRQLIEQLKAWADVHVIIVGASSEEDWIEQYLGPVIDSTTVSLAGRTTIAQLFEIIRSADLFVGNNSGPLHMAAACGVPLVTFAGGVPLQRWGVAVVDRNVVLGVDKRCPVCTEYECDRHGEPCLAAITVAETLAAARTLLGRQSAAVV